MSTGPRPRLLQLLLALPLVVLALPLFAGFSQSQDFRPATPAELAMAGTTSAVILDWVRVDDDTTSTSSDYYRIKIFNEQGRKYADVEIPYMPGYPSFSRVADVSARTILPDGKIVPFNGEIYDKVLAKAGRRQLKAKAFSLGNVQPGSIIEYRYQRRWRDNLLFDTVWLIQREVPVLHAKMSLKPANTKGQFGSYFSYVGLPAGKTPVKTGDTYNLELENVPALQEEAYAPPQDELASHVNFYYTESRVRPEEFWSVQALQWTKTIENFVGGDGAYRQHVAGLQVEDPMQTLKKVYAKAQSLRNLSFATDSLDEGSRSAADVLAHGAGYRDEINRAFVGMARALGFDATAVRVAPRDEFFFSDKLPNPEQMAGEIASVVVNGQTLFLDPGTPGAPFGIVSWEKANVPGFRVSRKAAPQWLKVPEAKPHHALTNRRADLTLTGDALEGTIVVTFAGQEAIRRRLDAWSEDEATRRKRFEEEAKTWFTDGAAVKIEGLEGATDHAEPLVARYSVKLPVSAAGSRTVVPLSVFEAASKNPFAPTTRTHPVYFHYPWRTDDEVHLTLPETMAPAALPPPVDLNAGSMTYTNSVTRDGKTIVFKRSMTVDGMLVDVKYYNALRNFFSSAVAADQKPLVVVSKSTP